MKLLECNRERFLLEYSQGDTKLDRFASTFRSKADMQEIWNRCWGAYTEDGEALMGAVIMTLSKRTPRVANLQLLHTFAQFRKRGAGNFLMDEMVKQAKAEGARYFRVSADPAAVDFYKAIGFKFWGKQKSGCQLCIFKFENGEPYYNIHDSVIRAAVYKKGKGGCVELFDDAIEPNISVILDTND